MLCFLIVYMSWDIFQTYYVKAMDAYNDENWEKAASNFEKSLNHYYREEENCRAQCESGYVHKGFPDFLNAIAGKLIKEDFENSMIWETGYV